VTVTELPPVDTQALATTPASRRRVMRRLLRNPLAVAGALVVLVAVSAALLADLIAPYSPARTDFGAALRPPSGAHWFGTDELGRDQFSRVLYGLRVSVTVGMLAVGLSLLIGVPFGLLAGFYRLLDPLVSRLTDTLLAFPFLVLAVGLFAIMERSTIGRSFSIATPIIAIGVAQIPAVVRVTRGETLRLRGLDYVAAAVADGASDGVLLRRYILPNALSTLIVQATVAAPAAIIGESVLSFLGLGVKPPTPSLGVMLASAQPLFRDGPWMAVFPGLSIVLLTLALNLLGDGMRDAFDPKESRR
jgi:peptide/nickel transport system permease protein